MKISELTARLATFDPDLTIDVSSGIIGNDWGIGDVVRDGGRVLILPQPVYAALDVKEKDRE